MSDRRALHLDVAACLLLAAGMVVALCVFSCDPADPPAADVFPPRETPANLLGLPGAWVARELFQALGVAVYALLASWFLMVVLLFLRQQLLTWSLRLAGSLLLVPCAAVLADWLGPERLGGPVVGSGGSLGAWVSDELAASFGPISQGLFLTACIAVGLLLTADVVLFRVG
ncbi:MAG TPA: DNA translocase FtsK 4TM domain-containing protein, partial [Gemmataceae bacterium]|nr:DNA translocase FtsK 4TM domain-containing protein [Gemmataceae bacterium]